MQAFGALLGTIFVFGVIILVHEFGHFIMARKFNVFVEEFSIGMGPALYQKQGLETLFSIRAIPFGGYCLMLGEDVESDDDDDSEEDIVIDDALKDRTLNSKSIPKRMLIFLGGILFNVILAFVLYAIVLSITGFPETTILEVKSGYPIEKAGLLSGDQLIKINDKKIHISEDFDLYNALHPELEDVHLTYKRDGKIYETIVHLEPDETGRKVYGFTRNWVSGIFGRDIEGMRNAGLGETLKTTHYTALNSIESVVKGLGFLLTGKAKMDDMAGPIGIGAFIGETMTESLEISFGAMVLSLFQFMALLSANLAVMNFLPLPGLDGGHILFLLLEALRGKPLEPEKQGIINLVGLALILVLAVFVAFSDIRQILSNLHQIK